MKKIILIFSLLLIASILYPADITQGGILFEYEDESAQSVFLVGSMNDWSTTATPMEKDEDGVWKILLKLDYGKYTYKFMVDGNWQVDQENPTIEDDGYGGSNSVIEYNNGLHSYGKPVEKSMGNSHGIKSDLNPKIYFKGRYFSDNVFLKNETDRFMLSKPVHDLNFGIKIRFNPDFEGYTVLNVNNSEEGSEMWKTHFNYKRSYLRLNADYFNITAFDNSGLISFDDPLHIVGDIGYNGYNFGYDFSGLYGETSNLLSDKISTILPISVNAQLLFSDKIGYSEDDISAARVKLSSPIFSDDEFTFGASDYRYTTQPSDGLVQYHDNFEFDFRYSKNITREAWSDAVKLEISGEFSAYENSDDDGVKSVWMKGDNLYLGASIKFPAALKVYADYMNSSFDLGTHFSRDKFTVGFNYNLKNFKWDASGKFWKNNHLDSLGWGDYYKYVEMTDGNGRWFQQHTELPFEKYTLLGYDTGFMWESNLNYEFQFKNHRVETILKNRFAHHNMFAEPKFIESIVVFRYDISDKWKLKVDTRIPYYNDPFLGMKTDFSNNEDVFISNYSEISYYLSEHVWIALGYGVNPLSMNSITDKFYNRGREEYLDNIAELPQYLESYYGGFGEKIRKAETSLMDERRISLRAVVEF